MMSAIWMVLSRRIAGQLAFLLVVAGYNPRKDRSINDRLYLLYVILFFSIWIFAVLTLFASWAASILLAAGQAGIPSPAVNLMLIAVGVWGAVKLWQAASTSPFVFSEEDGLMLCQTPVDRRVLAILWFFHAWAVRVLPFAGLAVVFGFARVEISAGKQLEVTDLPYYWAAGLRAFFAMALAHLLTMALVWLFGLARVRADRDIPHYRWVATAVIALFVASAFSNSRSLGYLIFPWKLALESGMGIQYFYIAVLAAGLPALGVLGLLWLTSDRLNLSRAAQETAYVQQLQAARWLGDNETQAAIRIKRRLGNSHAATRLPITEGAGVIFWRDLLLSLRGKLFANLSQIAIILVVTLLILLAPDLGSRLLVVVLWVLLLSRYAANQMRATLKQWWLWTQLPIDLQQDIFWQILPIGLLIAAFSGLALFFIHVSYPLLLFSLITVAVVLVMLAGIFDIIRQASSHSELLAVESVPGFTIIGVLIGIIVLILPFWFYLQPFSSRAYVLIPGWGSVEIVLLWLWIAHLWRTRR